MKLTKTAREIFLNNVMADVPFVDYEQQIEEAVRKEFVDKLPPAVRRVWDDAALRSYIETRVVSLPRASDEAFVGYVYVPCLSDERYEYAPNNEVQRLVKLNTAQKELRNALMTKLQAVASSCTTDKALREALPEFAKYVPSDTPTDRSVPTLTGVVDAFKQAGWPSDKK